MAKPMLQMDIEITPHPVLIVGGFFRAANHFRSFEEPLKDAINNVIIPGINHNFEVGGVPPWEPLSNATIFKRMEKGTGLQILVETGTLKQIATSIQPWTIHDNEAFFLSSNLGDAYYGAYHESGTQWMPARPWSTVSSQELDKVEQIFAVHALGGILKFTLVTTLVGGLLGGAVAGFGGILRSLTGGR